MSTSVFCIAPSETVADTIVSRLKSEKFADNDISVLFPDKSTTRDFAHEKNTKAPEGAVTGAGAGGIVGGTLGLLAGIGLLAIPGLGPFIAAGPIMASLSGIAAGAVLGGITGALIGMGIPELVAKRYEGKLKDGNILIAVHAEDSERVKCAKEIFESEDAEDITTGSTSSVPNAKDRDDMATTSPGSFNDRDGSNRSANSRVGGANWDKSAADSTVEMGQTGRDPIKHQGTPLR